MWCSRIRDLFRKILEENPRILSKNGYIIMYGKLYENDKVHNGYPTDYIYCSVCDSLVFIPGTSAGTGQCPRKISMSWTCPGHCPGHVPSKCPVQISIIFRY